MATIKAIVMEKLQQEGAPKTDDDVRNWLLRKLGEICFALPGENNPETNPVGVEFSKVMFLADSAVMSETEDGDGRDLHEKAIGKLIEKIREERDDLCDYPNLRQKIVDSINDER